MTTSPEIEAGVVAGERPATSVLHQATLCGGKGNRYKDGCRCNACRATVARYMRDSRRRNAMRRWGHELDSDLVSPEEAAKAVWAAVSVYGMTFRQISEVTGVTPDMARRIYYQLNRHITRKTHNAVVRNLDFDRGVQDRYTERQLVDAAPYSEILLRLMAQGWTRPLMRDIAKKNRKPGYGFILHSYETIQIRANTAATVMWLARTIGDRRGPSLTNMKRMWARGVFPQIHYTEDGRLIRDSLLPEQRQLLDRANRRVQSKHGDAASRNHGDGPRP